jgi:signal transduction histidine kinase
MNNILSNATKYSHQNGEILINIAQEENTIICEIKDNGTGISEKDMERIFDKFYRSTDHADIKGFGLGLTIVKRFCSLLNIQIEITSAENNGTTVFLRIPQS